MFFLKYRLPFLHPKRAHKFGTDILIALIKSVSNKNLIYIKNINLFICYFFKYIFLLSSPPPQYCKTLTKSKGFGSVNQHIQKNYPYPYLNSRFFVPPLLLFKSQHDSTNYCGVIVISHKQNLPLSKLTTATQVDTKRNNDDDTWYFPNTRKKNRTTPENLKQ